MSTWFFIAVVCWSPIQCLAGESAEGWVTHAACMQALATFGSGANRVFPALWRAEHENDDIEPPELRIFGRCELRKAA